MKQQRLKLFVILLLAVIVGLICWSTLIEPDQLFVRNYEISVPRWPSEFDGMKVAVVSDLHVGSHFIDNAKVKRVVDEVNACHPDLILLLGDYVYTDPSERAKRYSPLQQRIASTILRDEKKVDSASFIAELALLKARLGVYAVLGNHDWYFGGNELRKQMQSAGLHVLENSSECVEFKNKRLRIAGLADAWERIPDIRSTLAQIPADEPILLMTHNPDVFPHVPGSVNLTLAGHTHGGQVSLPLIGPLVVPSHYHDRYAKGLIVEDGRKLFVSTGIGTSVFPIRFGVPPEISVLTLNSPRL
jgi:uncharacterized protein